MGSQHHRCSIQLQAPGHAMLVTPQSCSVVDVLIQYSSAEQVIQGCQHCKIKCCEQQQ